MARESTLVRPASSTCLVIALAVAGLGAAACHGEGLERVRSVTYPPDFHYITQQEVRTTMGSLAVEIATLDALLGSEAVANSENRDAVIASLTRMRSLAGQLKKGARSNHPRIGANAPRLREDIESALDGARRLPVPDYYDAGRVVGSCNYCHAPPLSSPRRG